MADPIAFTTDHVARLTGLSDRQLRYWDETGFFAPAYSKERRRPYSRIYSFRDVIGLRAIAVLRNKHQVPPQELRRVGAWLQKRCDAPWSALRFYVCGRRVYFDDPAASAILAGTPVGQASFPFELEPVAADMKQRIDRMRERGTSQIGKIEQHRHVVHNAPVLAGTRIPTSAVWNFHQAGYGPEAIIQEYPRLTVYDVLAAIGYEEERRRKQAG